jgi:hypothetical protein
VVAGSFIYTAPANEFNDENIFVLGSVHNEVEGISVAHNPCRGPGSTHEGRDRADHRWK